MRVSGFSIVRNGVKYFYPFIEAIKSILPLCDEFILNVGDSDDGTLDAVLGLKDNKIKIVESKWDMNLRKGGEVLSIETNKALKECTGDWCFYIQADEVLHEKYFPVVKAAMENNLNKKSVEGLKFRYKHFYGSYDYYQDNYRMWYIAETRIIRRSENIVSWGDAMNFKHRDGTFLNVVPINAEIYHYGWVKPPDKMTLKRIDFNKLYFTDKEIEVFADVPQEGYTQFGHLKRFTGTHPAVMQERVSQANWDFDAKLNSQPSDWIRKIFIFLHPLTKRFKKLFNKN
jgi:glycosyltransferase involved in cell wall biosynthesis